MLQALRILSLTENAAGRSTVESWRHRKRAKSLHMLPSRSSIE
jgi:hypothetical protein